MPNLLFINSRFRIGAPIWEGPVVASADAIYLVQVRPVSAIGEVGRSFGLIGGLVAAAAQSVTGSRRSVSTCRRRLTVTETRYPVAPFTPALPACRC